MTALESVKNNLSLIANHAHRGSSAFYVTGTDIRMRSIWQRVYNAIANACIRGRREDQAKKLDEVITQDIAWLNGIGREAFLDEYGAWNDLFLAAQKCNQVYALSQGLSVPSIVVNGVPELKPLKHVDVVKSVDTSERGPDCVKGKFYYDVHTHKNHSLEALRIFFNTLFEKIGSKCGVKRCHYFQNGETESDIYDARNTPLLDGKGPTSYWVGHATCLLNVPVRARNSDDVTTINILTDPVEGDLLKVMYERQTRAARKMHALPKIDVVVLSHNHRDHYSKDTLRQLVVQQPVMIVPEGDKEKFVSLGFKRVQELNWWDKACATFTQDDKVYALNVTAVPANHWSGTGLCDGHQATFLGFVFNAKGLDGDIYFAGDTARLKEEHIGKLRDKYDIRWMYQPGGPDEVRKDMETTHQASVDGLWMHFNLSLKHLHKKLGSPSKEVFLRESAKYLTLFMHTKTFKLGNLHFDDTDRSMGQVLALLGGAVPSGLKSYEIQVHRELIAMAGQMSFDDGSVLTGPEIAALLRRSVIVPKIGEITQFSCIPK